MYRSTNKNPEISTFVGSRDALAEGERSRDLYFSQKGGEKIGNTQEVPLIASPFPKLGEMPVTWGRGKDTRFAENHKAIVDLDTGKLFSIVSKDYRVILHEEAILQVEQAIASTKGLGKSEIITKFSNAGGRMRRTYIFKEVGIEVTDGDVINPELHLFNSYDTKWPFIILLGAFRVICTNGLIVGQKLLHLRKRHICELGQINVADEIGTALERFDQQPQEWKGWTEKKLSPNCYEKVLERMKLGAKAKDQIWQRMTQEAEGFDPDGFPILTVWGFYNILTYHITHNAVSLNHQVELQGRLRMATAHWMS